MRISHKHAERYRAYYAARPVVSLPSRWVDRVGELADRLGAHTVLDYGCGPGRGISRFLARPVRDYDPGVEGLDAAPKPADLVICVHTLEHVEPESFEEVLAHLKRLARRALFVVVSCEPSTKMLPDGTPWHTLVHDVLWWRVTLGTDFVEQPCLKKPGAEYAALFDVTARD